MKLGLAFCTFSWVAVYAIKPAQCAMMMHGHKFISNGICMCDISMRLMHLSILILTTSLLGLLGD